MEINQLSRQEADSLLLSLQQLEENEAFQIMRSIAEELYKSGLASIAQTVPGSIKDFVFREQAIGGTQELKRFLDQPATMREDLNQQIENQHNER
jgi:hypothetical protein